MALPSPPPPVRSLTLTPPLPSLDGSSDRDSFLSLSDGEEQQQPVPVMPPRRKFAGLRADRRTRKLREALKLGSTAREMELVARVVAVLWDEPPESVLSMSNTLMSTVRF